jgi:hypothetical protein
MYQYKKDGNYALMHLPQGDALWAYSTGMWRKYFQPCKNTKFDTRSQNQMPREKKLPPLMLSIIKDLNYMELIPYIIKAVQKKKTLFSKQNEVLQKQVS